VSKILIADDNSAGRNLLTKILNSAKYKVITSKNGEEALTKFNKLKPDLVITDVKMPVMDGFELASAIRNDSSTAHVPIIFVSAMYKDISSKTKAIDTGGNEYLTLPIDRNELLYKVKSMLKSKALFDELLKSREVSQENEIKYRELFNNASDAIYIIDPDSQKIIDCNPKALEMVGYSKRQIMTMNVTELYPDKEQGVVEKIFNKVAKIGALSGISGINQLTKDGDKIPVEINATTFKLGDRKFTLSYVRDITRHKQIEDNLTYEKNSLTNILDSIEDRVYIVNDRFDIQYISPIFKKDFGSAAGRKCYEYFHNRKKSCSTCRSSDVFKGTTVTREWTSKNKKCYHIIDVPLKNPDGAISKIAIFRDITERKNKETLLKKSSISDNLTGLYNKRGLIEIAKKQLALAKDTGTIMFLLLISIDSFNDVDSTKGLSDNDKLLKDFSGIIVRTFHEPDILARIGKNDFAVLVSSLSGKDTGEAIVDHLHENIEAHNTSVGLDRKIQLSTGISCFDPFNPVSVIGLLGQAKKSIDPTGEMQKSNKNKFHSSKGSPMDQRQDKRFSPAKAFWTEIDDSSKGCIKDISRGGLCIQSDASLITDSIHEVKLLSDETMRNSIACIVIWSSKVRSGAINNRKLQYLNGLKYIGLNKKIRSSLKKYMEEISN